MTYLVNVVWELNKCGEGMQFIIYSPVDDEYFENVGLAFHSSVSILCFSIKAL